LIDLHIHLEEGPYTNNFFNKTITSIDTVNNTLSDGTLKDIERKEALFRKRLEEVEAGWYCRPLISL